MRIKIHAVVSIQDGWLAEVTHSATTQEDKNLRLLASSLDFSSFGR